MAIPDFLRHGLAARARTALLVLLVALIIALVFFTPSSGATPSPDAARAGALVAR